MPARLSGPAGHRTAVATGSPGVRRGGGRAVRLGITARDIITRRSLENAIAVVMALGGSTNAVLHLLAIAREAEVDLDWRTSTGSARGCRCWRT